MEPFFGSKFNPLLNYGLMKSSFDSRRTILPAKPKTFFDSLVEVRIYWKPPGSKENKIDREWRVILTRHSTIAFSSSNNIIIDNTGCLSKQAELLLVLRDAV